MLHVAAVILRRDEKVLICRRGPGAAAAIMWEFPGGKVEPGESPADCARRECREELGVEVELGTLYEQTTYAYPEKTDRLYVLHRPHLPGRPLHAGAHRPVLGWAGRIERV